MQHFFILSNLGIDIKKWNQELISNPFLVSHFDMNNPRYYLNRRITFPVHENEKIYTRHFDILVFNWQTGFKDALDFSKIIILKSDYDSCVQKLRINGLIHKKYITSYLDFRNDKIAQIQKRNQAEQLELDDNKDMYSNLQKLVDFLGIPFFFNLGKDR